MLQQYKGLPDKFAFLSNLPSYCLLPNFIELHSSITVTMRIYKVESSKKTICKDEQIDKKFGSSENQIVATAVTRVGAVNSLLARPVEIPISNSKCNWLVPKYGGIIGKPCILPL